MADWISHEILIRDFQVDEEQRPLNFTQVFQLMPADGSFYVLNDVFRLVQGLA